MAKTNRGEVNAKKKSTQKSQVSTKGGLRSAVDTAAPFFKSHTLAQKVRILISSTAPRRPLPFWHTIMHHHTTPEPQPFAPGTKRAAAVARARNDFHGARSLKTAKWVLRRGGRYQSCPAGAGVAVQAAPHRPRPRRPPAEARPGRGGLRRGQVNGIGVRRGKWILGATCT